MSLKELTYEHHKKAETQPFVKVLFSGEIDPKLYALYLKNQHPQYEILEVVAMAKGLLNGLTDIRRAPALNADFQELWDSDEEPKLCPVVKKYIDHIMSIKDDPKKLMAHIYVRHMGDLYGGQMIAKKVPGSKTFYKFEDPDALKAAIREKLDDSMAEEAMICFDFATELFQEMMEFVNE